MTTATGNRVAAALLAVAATSVLGGCSTVSSPQSPSGSSSTPGSAAAAGPASAPVTDDQSRAQVVDAATEAVRAAGLRVTYASFQWEWCNDQGEPPFHGRVDVTFDLGGAATFPAIAATLARQPGWAPGPPPGFRPAGDVVHRGGVMVIVGPTAYPDRGTVQVYGECTNMNDHRRDNQIADITRQVSGP
jgi:hypothetical protein